MEELQDASIHHTTAKLINAMKTLKNYEPLYQNVQKLVCSPGVDRYDMCNTLEEAIKDNGIETEIRNILFHLIRSKLKIEEKGSQQNLNEPLSYLRRAGVQWDRRVRKSLNAMCSELKMACQGQPRISADREEFLNKWDELSNYSIDLANYRPVYAPKDILEVLLSLKGPTKTTENTELLEVPKWEFSHISLSVKNLFELRNHYNDLLRNETYAGAADINLQCQRVLESKHAVLCQHLLRKGNTPAPFRGSLWTYVLDSHVKDYDIDHWNKLKSTVLATDHIVDKLIFKDIQLTASNDDQYFVFEDVLYQVMLCFSRDLEIAEMIQFEHYPVKGKHYESPPSGVVPFHGICMFGKEIQVSIWNDNELKSLIKGIVSICLLFEKLLQTYEPQLWSHLRELQIQPIRVVFKWLMRAFSGHLPPDQLLILWDLILGFDSLEILSLFAIIILSFRKESIMQVTSLDNIEAILADLSSIKVLPLIQLALSRD